MRILLLSGLLLVTFFGVQAQIVLHNPSFEIGLPSVNYDPPGWMNCIFAGETGGDLHGRGTKFFGVEEEAVDGTNFIGLVTRDNNTWETIGTALPEELQAGYAYTIQFHANKSETFQSITGRSTTSLSSYGHPAIVQVFGGSGACDFGELLAQTEPITGGGWELQKLIILPKKNYSHLYFSAYYPDKSNFTRGNVLLDAFAPIEMMYDTSRYEFLCLNGELVTYYEKVALDAEKLLETVLIYNEEVLATSNPDFDLSPEEYNIGLVNQLHQRVKKYGVFEYFYKVKTKVKRRELAALKNIGAEGEWEVLNRGLEIFIRHKKGEAREEDQANFVKLQEEYTEVEDLENLLLEYVLANKQTLIDGFGKCPW